MKLKKTEKRTEHGIAYEAWDDVLIKKFPIEKKHIGLPVRVAFSHRSKDYILNEIKAVGDPGFPHGGYLVKDSDKAFSRPIFLDEAICFPPKKKRKTKSKKKTKASKKPKKSKSKTKK